MEVSYPIIFQVKVVSGTQIEFWYKRGNQDWLPCEGRSQRELLNRLELAALNVGAGNERK